MTFLAEWSTALVLVLLAAVGVGTARSLTEWHIRNVQAATNWVERNQRFAAADQAVTRTRQWMFFALWVVASIFAGWAAREVWIAYLVTLVVTNNKMKRLMQHLWAFALQDHTMTPPFATGPEGQAIGLGYMSYFAFVFTDPGVWWIGAAALLIAALRLETQRHAHLDLTEFMIHGSGEDSDADIATIKGSKAVNKLSGEELNAWISFEIARHPDFGAAQMVATAQKLIWFGLAVLISRRTAVGEPLLALWPVALTAAAVAIHQLGNRRRRRLEHQADAIGTAAVADKEALGRAFEVVAKAKVEPLVTNARGTESWWDRMERIGHTPAIPKPRPLTVIPALGMIAAVSLAMFVVASFVLPIAHASGPEVEAAVILGTGREPATTWSGNDILGSIDDLLRSGSAPLPRQPEAFGDVELGPNMAELIDALRSDSGCIQTAEGLRFTAISNADGSTTLSPGCR